MVKTILQTIKQFFITIIVCSVLLVGVGIVYSWTGPTQAPPAGNVDAPINVSANSQIKSGALQVNGFRNYLGNTVLDGSVGIGISTPGSYGGKQSKLDITGYTATNDVWLKDVSKWASQVGGGVVQINAGAGITLSPNPITNTGTVSLANPSKSCSSGYMKSFDLSSSNNPTCNTPLVCTRREYVGGSLAGFVTVPCLAGEFVTGGGCDGFGLCGTAVLVTTKPISGQEGWSCDFDGCGSNYTNASGYAICCKIQ